MRVNKLLSSIQVVLAALCLSTSAAWAAGTADALDQPALACRKPAQAVLLDITTAGSRLVAVGERGIIIYSNDGGQTWLQAKVPTSVSLTAVQFPTPKQGWAVGHAGVVLHSEDGGETWTKQLDGRIAAQLALDAANADVSAAGATGATAEVAKRHLADAQRLVDDGPGKPFLALQFENEQSGFIVGAYGLMYRTTNGGKTWQSWMNRLDNPKGLHLNAIRAVGQTIYLAGEQGLFFRSTDGGNTFTPLATPYQGSYFALAALPSGEIVVAGMRGNAYWSADQGKTFTKIESPMPISISAITQLADGRLLFANQAGILLESRDHGRSVQPLATPRMPTLAGMTQLHDGSIVAVGFGGALLIPRASNTGGAQ
jgi:photosystem II stability/assembly factor-like uncharacterized protein